MKKKNICILFGGPSLEHEVSILSTKNILDYTNKKKYNIFLVGITKKSKWFLLDQKSFFKIKESFTEKIFLPNEIKEIDNQMNFFKKCKIDATFPVMHGYLGEDGIIQGFLKLVGVPCVGPGLLSSSICMDKDITKRLLKEAGLLTARYLLYYKHEVRKISFNKTKKELGLPLFVKPANAGSSVGVSKVFTKKEFDFAIKEAFRFDSKILVEEFILGKEIECAVLGNEHPKASVCGEIISTKDFYSYEAKYLISDGATTSIPARISNSIQSKIQETALKAFKCLNCVGMSRVDFFLTIDNTVYINEINTIPGFTSISMYPKLWEATGLSYSDLIDKLISLAISEFENNLKSK